MEVIQALSNERVRLQSDLNKLKDTIEKLEARQIKRKGEVSTSIASAMTRLLKLDLPLQAEFIAPSDVKVDFSENSIYVNGARNFSESSAVVLRHIFHLALLTASMEKHYMRVPRILMLDGIDDGGMEKERSHNLQKIIVQECERYTHDYQVIFATSEINPDLEKDSYVVGKRPFTPEHRSLNVR
jgi:hypothetical protein